MPKPRRNLRPELDQLDRRCLLSTLAGLTPSQLTSAYGLSGITFSTPAGQSVQGNGAGQTIALIDMYHDPNLASDLHTFDQQFGLPDPALNVINQAGNQVDNSWGQEESLDVEVAHAVAPAARIVVVEAAPGITNNQMFQNLMTAVQTASQTPGVSVVSMSWGFNEFPGETQYDSYFTTPGITYIAASGDTASVEYPAASPDVLSVGGTTLNLGASGSYASESAWYDSGGGYSLYEAEPSYQMSVQTSGLRSTPDVAFDGDPNTGLQVFFTPASGPTSGQWAKPQGSWATFGGTSLGAPAWAGLIAIVDQGRLLTGSPSLTGSEQTLPSLYSLAASGYHAVAPTTITSPWTGGGFAGWGGFGDWSGYDGWNGLGNTSTTTSGGSANTQTGLGTPVGPALIHALVASHLTAPLYSPDATNPPSAPGSAAISSPPPAPVSNPSSTPTHGRHHRHPGRVRHHEGPIKAHAVVPRHRMWIHQGNRFKHPSSAGHRHHLGS